MRVLARIGIGARPWCLTTHESPRAVPQLSGQSHPYSADEEE